MTLIDGQYATIPSAPGALNSAYVASASDANNNTKGPGTSALASDTTGTQNTVEGYRALTANTTGSQGTAIGYLALAANTTGTGNTAVGANALAANTTSSNSTAVGVNALQANTAANNTALGFDAMQSTTTGTGNTAVGSAAAQTLTTGNNNTAIGSNALIGNGIPPVTGSANTAVGAATLNNLSTGGTNTAVGFQSLFVLIDGSNNVAIGNAALNASLHDSGNTAVGNTAFQNLNGAGQGVAVGNSAGFTPAGVAANATVNSFGHTLVGQVTGLSDADNGAKQYISCFGYSAIAGGGSYGTALGANTAAKNAGAVAIGCDHLGTGASTTTQDEIKLGTANHTVNTPTTPAIGNGASANLTALLKGTGGGPASDVVAQWIPWRNGALSGWIPFFQ